MGTPKLEGSGLDTVRVSEIMVTPVRTVPPDLSVSGFIRILLAEQITGAPVVDGENRLLGVVSSSDVMRALLSEEEVAAGDTLMDPGPTHRKAGDDPQEVLLGYFQSSEPSDALLTFAANAGPVLSDLTVGDIMTRAAFTIAPDATVRELAAFLTRGRIHRSLVVERGALRGIVTSSDVVRLIAGDAEQGRER